MATDKTILKVVFHIHDVEWEDNYDYEGLFFDLNEVKAFMYDNIEAGNVITIIRKEEIPATIRTLLEEYPSHF